jgi:hypothetical protein
MNQTVTDTPLHGYPNDQYIQSVGENLIKQQNYKRLYYFNRFFIAFMEYHNPK